MSRIRARVAALRLPPPPVAGFSAPVTNGIAPVSLALVDESQHATSLQYTAVGHLGGLLTSTDRSPTFNFTSGEFWTITQVVSNRTGTDQMVRTAYISTTAAPEIEVRGNGVLINNGDLTPSFSDWTDYGNALQGDGGITRVFKVRNNGSLVLNRTAATTVPSGFTLVQDIPASVAIGAEVDLIIRLGDVALGPKLGLVQINTNDFDEGTTQFRIQGETVPTTPAAPGTPPTTGQVVTVLRSDTSGAQWITPVGIPGKDDTAWPASSRDIRLWAKYGSNYVPVQTEHFLSWESNGAAKHGAGHFRVPPEWAYTAGTNIELFYGFDGAHPAAPNWPVLTSGYTNNFDVVISEYRPKIYGLVGHREPIQMDSVTVSFSTSKGVKSYTRTFTDPVHHMDWSGSTIASTPQTLTGATSGATATLINIPAASFCRITSYTGQFVVGETVTGSLGGTATVVRAPYPRQIVRPGLAQSANGVVADLVRDVQSDGFLRCWQKPPIKIGPPLPATGITDNDYAVSDTNLQATGIINHQTRAGFFGFRFAGHTGDKHLPFEWTPSPPSDNFLSPGDGQFFAPFWPQDYDLMDEDYTATVQITRANANGRTSNFAVRNGPLLTDVVTSGPAPMAVMQARQARKLYTASWATGVATARSPIFNGHQVRQEERLCPFLDAFGDPHPHLECLMVTTFAATGAIIFRAARFINAKMFAGAREVFYDVEAININGSNQINPVADKALYRGLIHTTGAHWTWKTPRPSAHCDPTHYMKTKLIPAYTRAPTRNQDRYIEMMEIKSRGMHSDRDIQWFPGTQNINAPVQMYAATAAYGSVALGEPLWPALMVFDASGGARGEKWCMDLREWAFWTNNTFLMWPHIEALATNGWGGWPWFYRDESAADDHDKLLPPDFYTRWYFNLDKGLTDTQYDPPNASRAYPSWGYQFRRSNNPGVDHGYTGTQPYRLWTGTDYGNNSVGRLPATSHSPTHPARTAYLIQPDIWYLDDVMKWAWVMQANNVSSATPKTGGVMGDVNHVLSIGIDNGNRRVSWPTRDVFAAASIIWEGHPKRARWRRYATDLINHLTLNVAWGFMGGFDIRYPANAPINSDTWDTTARIDGRAGQPVLQINASASGAGVAAFLDREKSYYVHAVMAQAHAYELGGTQAMINASRWIWTNIDQAPAGRKLALFGVTGFFVSGNSNTINYINDTGFIWPTEDVPTIIAWLDSKTGGALAEGLNNYRQDGTVTKTASPDGTTWTDLAGTGFFYSQYYGGPGMHRSMLAVYSDLVTGGDAAIVQAAYNLVKATFPLNSFTGTGDPFNRAKYRRDFGEALGNLSHIRWSELPAGEW